MQSQAPRSAEPAQAADMQFMIAREQRVMELQSLRRELTSQIDATRQQQQQALEALDGVEGAAKAMLIHRAEGLNSRLEGLEKRLSEVGQELAQLQPSHESAVLVETSSPFQERTSMAEALGFNPMPIIAVFVIFVLGPLATALARRIWYSVKPGAAPAQLGDVSARLGRLEQAVDTVAVEVERISEGQRFASKLLAEQAARAGALGDGEKVPQGR